jgi:hypothetical protein
MARCENEVSPQEAADKLGVHKDTIYRWCNRALHERTAKWYGFVRQDVTGHYWIQIAAVEALLAPQ